jgi:hypothetical protein
MQPDFDNVTVRRENFVLKLIGKGKVASNSLDNLIRST